MRTHLGVSFTWHPKIPEPSYSNLTKCSYSVMRDWINTSALSLFLFSYNRRMISPLGLCFSAEEGGVPEVEEGASRWAVGMAYRQYNDPVTIAICDGKRRNLDLDAAWDKSRLAAQRNIMLEVEERPYDVTRCCPYCHSQAAAALEVVVDNEVLRSFESPKWRRTPSETSWHRRQRPHPQLRQRRCWRPKTRWIT
jgi:hypothetical protein